MQKLVKGGVAQKSQFGGVGGQSSNCSSVMLPDTNKKPIVLKPGNFTSYQPLQQHVFPLQNQALILNTRMVVYGKHNNSSSNNRQSDHSVLSAHPPFSSADLQTSNHHPASSAFSNANKRYSMPTVFANGVKRQVESSLNNNQERQQLSSLMISKEQHERKNKQMLKHKMMITT